MIDTFIYPMAIIGCITLIIGLYWGLWEFIFRKNIKPPPPRYKIVPNADCGYDLRERELRYTRQQSYWGYTTVGSYPSITKAKLVMKHLSKPIVKIG